MVLNKISGNPKPQNDQNALNYMGLENILQEVAHGRISGDLSTFHSQDPLIHQGELRGGWWTGGSRFPLVDWWLGTMEA